MPKYGGKGYDIIKSMYNNCNYCIKKDNTINIPCRSATGVKQGCNLSTTLSNILVYQNNLHDIFDSSCNSVKLGNREINSLFYACR